MPYTVLHVFAQSSVKSSASVDLDLVIKSNELEGRPGGGEMATIVESQANEEIVKGAVFLSATTYVPSLVIDCLDEVFFIFIFVSTSLLNPDMRHYRNGPFPCYL